MSNPPPALNYGGGNNHNFTKQHVPALGKKLLYKVFKGDTRLVRSLLEANSYEHTEGHDWNILWTSGNPKQYLYEGLNEYQKINHFP